MPRWGDQVLAFDRQGNMISSVHPTEIPLLLSNPSSQAPVLGQSIQGQPLGLGPAGLSSSQA